MSLRTAGPISIGVHSEINRRGAMEVKAKLQSSLDVAQDALHGGEVRLSARRLAAAAAAASSPMMATHAICRVLARCSAAGEGRPASWLSGE